MTFILAATPAYDGVVVTEYQRSFIDMVEECRKERYRLARLFQISTFPSRARNAAAAMVIANPDFTHLLTIDADMGWPAGLLTRLVNADRPVVGATYPRRAITKAPSFIGGIIGGANPETPIPKDGFMRAKYVGNGFTLIKREILLRMAEFHNDRKHVDESMDIPVWDLFPSGLMPSFKEDGGFDKKISTTDDVGFGILAEQAGIDIWADVRTSLSHTGRITVEIGAVESYMLARRENAKLNIPADKNFKGLLNERGA
jgi:hypothetical protein